MKETQPTEFDTIVEQGKEIIHEGSQRRLVFRSQTGDEIADMSMNTAVVLGLIMFFFQPLGMIAFIGLAIYGVTQKVRIELVRELTDNDDTVVIDK